MLRNQSQSLSPAYRGSFTPVASAVVLALFMPTAFAQAPAAAAEQPVVKPLETIVVTARKRSEELQTVPVAVTAFTGEGLKRANIESAADLQSSIPSAILVGGDTFTIRGIGNGSLGGDAGVGAFLNGAGISMLSQDQFYDLSSVEVLRGPQGTLFGRNTTGGAVTVRTRGPSGRTGGEMSLELGNYNERRFGGSVEFKVSEDIAQRFAGYMYTRDGFTQNLATGNRIDGRDQYGFRSSTRVSIGDNGTLNVVLGMYDEDSTRTRETKRLCKANAVLGCNPNESGFDSPAAGATVLQTLTRFFTPFPAGGDIYAGAPNPTDPRQVAADRDPKWTLKQEFATVEYTHELSQYALTYVGGFSKGSTEQNTDWDNAALPFRFTAPITYSAARGEIVTTDRLISSDSFTSSGRTNSHELRVNSKFKGSTNFTAGLFHLRSTGQTGFFAWHPGIEARMKAAGAPPESWFINTTGGGSLKTTAAFGSVDFKATDKLRVGLGARHTSEDRTSASRAIVLAAPGPVRTAESSTSATTGKVSVDFAQDRNTMYYGSIATGYKGGGFNIGNATTPTFAPEEVTAYEVGTKNTFMNGRLQANFTAFYNDYKQLQLGQRIGGTVLTANADAVTKGFEAEFAFAPDRQWLMDANLSILSTRIGSFMTVDGANPAQSLTVNAPAVAVNLDGKQLPYSPKSKVKVGAQYSMAVTGGWTAIARIDHLWQDAYFSREFNAPNDKVDAWGVTNLQVRFINPKGTIQVKGYVKNLADKDNITRHVVEDALLGSYRNARYLDPRTYGFAVDYKF